MVSDSNRNNIAYADIDWSKWLIQNKQVKPLEKETGGQLSADISKIEKDLAAAKKSDKNYEYLKERGEWLKSLQNQTDLKNNLDVLKSLAAINQKQNNCFHLYGSGLPGLG